MNRLVENVASIWKKTVATRGRQMIFADMGVNPTSWGYSVYDDVVRKLIASGIPREQIAAIGDAESDAKKQALFEKVRQGSVRVLIGSTQKMGTGTNVQKRLVALHHLDAPWKPAEVEQRDGRILRQGNENEEVAVYRYVTEGSFDAYMWVRRESCSFDCVACRKTMTTPAVPSAVAYRHVRCQQWQGAKLSRQRNPTRWVQSGTARNALSCQHQGGRGARLGGMTNRCEPTINPVNANRLKVPTSLNQKVCSRLLLSTLGAHGHHDCRGRVGVYTTVSNERNTVNPYPRPARGKPTARKAVGGAGMRSRRKRTPACNGSDTKPMLRPARVLTSEWSFVTRSLAEPYERRKANGRGPQDRVCALPRASALGQD